MITPAECLNPSDADPTVVDLAEQTIDPILRSGRFPIFITQHDFVPDLAKRITLCEIQALIDGYRTAGWEVDGPLCAAAYFGIRGIAASAMLGDPGRIGYH